MTRRFVIAIPILWIVGATLIGWGIGATSVPAHPFYGAVMGFGFSVVIVAAVMVVIVADGKTALFEAEYRGDKEKT